MLINAWKDPFSKYSFVVKLIFACFNSLIDKGNNSNNAVLPANDCDTASLKSNW